VRPSRIAGAGNGLFANQEFSPGDLVAAYTGQILPDELAPRIQFGASSYLQNMEGESVILIGDPHPSTPHLGAQLANDPLLEAEDLRMLLAVNCNDSRPESLAPFKAFTQKYWARTLEGRDNVLLDSRPFGPTSLPVFKAIRPIRAGEEILYPYGASYWLMSAVQICHRKGLSETGLAIQRAASAAVEEAARSARNPIHQLLFQGIIEMDSAYISEETYQRRLAVFKAIPLETKIIHLFAPAGQMGLTPTGTREDDLELLKTRSELMEKFGLKEKLLTLAEIPNSEFFDEHSYGKPHARSKQIMTEFVQFLKDSGQAKVGWFFDIKKHRPIAWDDFIRMIAH
jgi:hypothetical protein